jgi:hypothetical protein
MARNEVKGYRVVLVAWSGCDKAISESALPASEVGLWSCSAAAGCGQPNRLVAGAQEVFDELGG